MGRVRRRSRLSGRRAIRRARQALMKCSAKVCCYLHQVTTWDERPPTHGLEHDMARQYYVETEHRTSETSDRLEAARIAAEWKKRGYKVETVVVDVTDESVQLVDNTEVAPRHVRAGAPVAAPVESRGAERAVPDDSAPAAISH
jgi:hypothetical protein